MSRSDTGSGEPLAPRHPRQTTAFFGHGEGEQALLAAYRSGRVPHAWLIGGPRGIGKATLAYRMARFVLANPDPSAPAVQAARTLALEASHSVVCRVAAQAHPNLLVLERTENEDGVLRSVITVEQTARTGAFFGTTAGEGGWRICLVDSVDELHAASANKLLKILEEPPSRALFLIVSHAPGRLLATIRSRCRRLDLRPLSAADVARATAAVLDRDPEAPDIRAAAAAAGGSAGRALSLIEGPALALRQRVAALLAKLPATDPGALHGLGETLSGADDESFDAFVDTVSDWLSARLHGGPQTPQRLMRFAEAWERVGQATRDVRVFNLDRRPLVFAVFGLLAETAHG